MTDTRGTPMPDYTEQLTRIEAKVDRLLGVTPPPAPTPTPAGKWPSDVLPLLKRWTVTTTTGPQGDPDNEYYVGKQIPGVLFVQDGGVVFRAGVDGAHTPNSKFCRVEGRQMADGAWKKAAWRSSDGVHTLTAELAIDTSGLVKRKRVNGLQIHDGSDDVMQVMRHETLGLGVMTNDGGTWLSLDPAYSGGRFTCGIRVEGGTVQVTYNAGKVVRFAKSGSGWFWKAGCYLQSDMTTWGEPSTSWGQVTIWRLDETGTAVSR
jgi:Alginate lyase